MKEQFVNVVVDKLERGLSEVAGVAGTVLDSRSLNLLADCFEQFSKALRVSGGTRESKRGE